VIHPSQAQDVITLSFSFKMIPLHSTTSAQHPRLHSQPKMQQQKQKQLYAMAKPLTLTQDNNRGEQSDRIRSRERQDSSTCPGCQRCELEQLLASMEHSPICFKSTNFQTKPSKPNPAQTPATPKSHVHIMGLCRCGNILRYNLGNCRCQKPYYRHMTLVPITFEAQEVAVTCWSCRAASGESTDLVQENQDRATAEYDGVGHPD
jgi:hypothetical protein